MTTPKAVPDVPVAIRTNSLAVTHVVKFLPGTTRAGFDHTAIYLVVGCIVTDTGRVFTSRTLNFSVNVM
jgi:hypothetical protein